MGIQKHTVKEKWFCSFIRRGSLQNPTFSKGVFLIFFRGLILTTMEDDV
jgi:hypothetical protein